MLRQLNGNRNGRTRRPRSSIRDAAAPVVEMMEPRKMFSVSVNDWGQLNIYPDNPGNINVWSDGLFVHTIVDGTQDVFAVPIVKSIHIGAMWTSNISIGSNLPGPVDIYGSWGDDVISIGDTKGVTIDASSGNDFISGSPNNDVIYGGPGDDTIYGNAGNDDLNGDQTAEYVPDDYKGKDVIHGGSGNDTIDGMESEDSLYGDSGDDYLRGGKDEDSLDGGAGNDTLDGGTGADFWQDSMSGGAGNDTASADSGFDLVDTIENFVGT
jgi:Ca2+-binding RTX toxin-like protein